jgi:hypothetical protein
VFVSMIMHLTWSNGRFPDHYDTRLALVLKRWTTDQRNGLSTSSFTIRALGISYLSVLATYTDSHSRNETFFGTGMAIRLPLPEPLPEVCDVLCCSFLVHLRLVSPGAPDDRAQLSRVSLLDSALL